MTVEAEWIIAHIAAAEQSVCTAAAALRLVPALLVLQITGHAGGICDRYERSVLIRSVLLRNRVCVATAAALQPVPTLQVLHSKAAFPVAWGHKHSLLGSGCILQLAGTHGR